MRFFSFVGRLFVSLIVAFLFLVLAAISTLPYGGRGNVGLVALSWLSFFGGLFWAVAALLGPNKEPMLGNSTSPSAGAVTSVVSGHSLNGSKFDETVNRAKKEEHEEVHAGTAELLPVLEASDVRKFVVTASKKRIGVAHANKTEVSRFFNAIRYGRTERVRKAVSANPLLILARDAYGYTPLEVADQEGNKELRIFFYACSDDSQGRR